jgi:ATP-binding cassette subfamily B protein
MLLMSFMIGEKKEQQFMKNYMTALEEMNTEAVEYVRGIPVVKVFQQTVYSFKNFHRCITNYKNMVTEYTNLWEKPMALYTVIINGFVFFLIPVAIILIGHSENYTAIILDLFLYVLITPIFSQSIMRSMYLTHAFGQAREAVSRIENLTENQQLPLPVNPRGITAYDISFRNVSFTYPEPKRKFLMASVSPFPRKIRCSVGSSGSGKNNYCPLSPPLLGCQFRRSLHRGNQCPGNRTGRTHEPHFIRISEYPPFQKKHP